MNFQDINGTFAYNKGLILHERSQAEIARKRKEQSEKARAENINRKQRALRNSIQSHFNNLNKFVKEIFSKPSELSQFLIEKVLSTPGCRLISRQKFVEFKTKSDDFPTLVDDEMVPQVSGHFEDEYFDAIDLVRIESLSNEKSEYFIALVVPNRRASGNKIRNDLRDVELVVYKHKQEEFGFERDYEDCILYPPVNVELRDILKSLNDLNVFCGVILKKYQHFVTS